MNPKTERECHCHVSCPMPDGHAYEGDHVIAFCSWHSRDDMQPGDRVRVIKDNYPSKLNSGSLVGRKGIVRTITRNPRGMNADVSLDSPFPDGRAHLYFSESSLEVISGRKRR